VRNVHHDPQSPTRILDFDLSDCADSCSCRQA
jgi:hypothetical protein